MKVCVKGRADELVLDVDIDSGAGKGLTWEAGAVISWCILVADLSASIL
jgi:hypothetical protein